MLPQINTGNTGFMLLCAALVLFMTPGLAFFYGGLVHRKNVLGVMIQSFVSMAWTTVLWIAFGYSMSFGPTVGGIFGNPFAHPFLYGIHLNSLFQNNAGLGIPTLVHVAYQMMFAIITPALITGAFANRVTFKAYLWFLTAWLIFVYFPFCHMLWSPEGILNKWGCLDFAGGIVVHNTAGLAALASVLYVGKRKVIDTIPHSIPVVALGTGMLWFGWYGFNAGSEFGVDSVTARPSSTPASPPPSPASPGWWWNGPTPSSPSSWACSPAPWPAWPPSPLRGLRGSHDRRPHRHLRRRGLLLRRGPEEHPGLGRRPGRLGRARRGRLHRHPPAGPVRRQGLEPGGGHQRPAHRGRLQLPRQAGGRRGHLLAAGRSCSPTACCGSSTTSPR